MKCPKCGSQLRPSKQQSGSYLCDTCKKRFRVNASKSKKRRRRNRKRLVTLMLLLLAIVATSVVFVFIKPSFNGSSESDNYAVGAIASSNGIELQITDFKRSEGTDNMKPSKGMDFLLLQITITNTGKSAANTHTLSGFRLYADEKPVKYSSYAYEAESANIKRIPEQLEAGESFNGTLCFEVPSKSSKLVLEYANPVWSSDKLLFDIK